MDIILPSAGTYKINARINNISLDELSFVSPDDKITPYFEEPVSGDPDVTGLMVFLNDVNGVTVGFRVLYYIDVINGLDLEPIQIEEKTENIINEDIISISDENDYDDDEDIIVKDSDEEPADIAEIEEPAIDIEQFRIGNEYFIPVKSLDYMLPAFPIQSTLSMGQYTMVSQVMSDIKILHKTEKTFYYLANAVFSFDGIQVNLPGIAAGTQHFQNGSILMLEVKLDYDNRLNPYVIWYNGRRVIGEGNISKGEGALLLQMPDQSGFLSLRAEVFPFEERQDLIGYQREVSLLVAAKKVEMHLLPEDTPNLLHWYVFEADLDDSVMKDDKARSIKPLGKHPAYWMAHNGTYGLAAGPDDVYILPNIDFSAEQEGHKDAWHNAWHNAWHESAWQIVSRFKPLENGVILSVQFGPSFDVIMNLSREDAGLVLTLSTSKKIISEVYHLPVTGSEDDFFITTVINFSLQPDLLLANFIINDNYISEQISLETELNKLFKVSLGYKPAGNTPGNMQNAAPKLQEFTAIWDELALLYVPVEKKEEEAEAEVESEAEDEIIEDELLETEEQLEAGDDPEIES